MICVIHDLHSIQYVIKTADWQFYGPADADNSTSLIKCCYHS